MRTKNFNLKKKIAFIASVTMIATTAAYLPAEVAQNIGIGSGIVASAAAATGSVIGEAGYDKAATSTGAAAKEKVETFDTFIKIDGKYLAQNQAATTSATQFKLYNTLTAAVADGYYLTTLNDIAWTQVAGNDKDVLTHGSGWTATTADDVNYNCLTAAKTMEIKLPYLADASKITLEFAARKGSSLSSRSVESIEVTLDENGIAKVPDQKSYVIGYSDDSNYDEKNEYFVDNNGDQTNTGTGSYEVLDLSGLQIRMGVDNGSDVDYKSFNDAKVETTNETFAKNAIAIADAYPEDDKVTPLSYEVKKVNGKYAKVMKATLTAAVAPDAQVKVQTGVYNTWTKSGNVASDGTVTLKMGNNGYAVSDLVTFTKDGVSEYYVYVVQNKAGVEETAEYEAEISGVAGLTGAALGTTANALNAAGRYKVTRKLLAESFADSLASTDAEKKSQKRYITEYTIYNNEIDDSEYSSSETNNNHYIDIALKNEAKGIVDGQKSAAGSKVLNQDSTNEGDFYVGGSQGTAIDNATKKSVRIAKTDAGTATSDIIKTSDDHYIRFVFTTDYEIKYDINNSDKNTTLGYDGKVEVSGRTITQPETPENKGYSFDGWDVKYIATGGTETSGTKQAFSVAAGTEQVNTSKDEITPNTKLVAKWKGLKYKVVLNAGEGIIANSATASDATFGKYFGETSTKTTELSNLEDIAGTDFATVSAVKAAREGYKVKGWTTVDGGDTALTAKTFHDAFPGENQTLNLYPVYEATKPTLHFYQLEFDANGRQKATDGKTDSIQAYGTTSADIGSAVYEVEMGEKLGTLPTPKLKGYTFNGWYIAKYTSTNVSAVKVDADTVVDEAITDTNNDGTMGSTHAIDSAAVLTLYAKFTQNEYNITYDLGDGEWDGVTDYDDDNSDKPVTYKVDNSGNIKYYNGNGTEVQMTSLAKPQVGSGDFTKFTGWTINNDTRKYATSAALASAIKNLEDASDLTLTATYKKNEDATSASIVLNANAEDAKFYTYADEDSSNKAKGKLVAASKTKALTTTTPGSKVAADYEVKDNQIGNASDKTGVVVARAGYTFKGWYTDAECTTPYTFDVYPEKGVETIVYAGWEAGTSTRYKINFNLINKNTSYVAKSDNDGYSASDDSDFTFTATFGGVTGSTVKAADKTFEVGGKTYNFSDKDSAGLDTEKELKAAYRDGYAKGATIYDSATDATTAGKTTADKGVTWVLRADVEDKDVPSNYVSGTSTTQNAKTGLNTGAFVLDAEQYTVIEGNYVEDYVNNDLGTATNVAVKDGTVTWTAADNADHYRIQKTVNGKTYYGAKVTAAKATYTVPVEEHEIAVVAYNADESEKTVSTVVKVAASTKLGKATNVKCAEDGTVTFSAATGATKYQVAKIVNGKTYYSAKSDATSIKISPATEDYEVYVIAFDSTGKLSTHSETIKVPAAASNLEAVDDATITVDGEGKVTWTAAKGAVAYKVFKITKNSEGKEVTNWGSKVTTTSYTFKNLPTTDYKVYVAAIDANGNVKYSAKKKISSLPAATNVKLSSDKKTVSWTAPTGTNADKIVKYQVAKFDPDANKTNYSVKVDAPATSITMRNAAVAGTKIFVLAFDADGNSSYSASIDVK